MSGRSLIFPFLLFLWLQMGSNLSGQSYFATINAQGDTEICRGDSVAAHIWFWSGVSPFTVVIHDNDGEYLVLEKYESFTTFYLHPESNNNYTIASVVDSKGRKGGTYGSVSVTVHQPTPVTIVAGQKAFLETDPGYELKSSPPGGDFYGTGISGSTFYPAVATSNGSPHQITCTYVNEYGCVSRDRESFFVLSGESSVVLLSGNDTLDTVCDDGGTYTLRGKNEDQLHGSFELFRKGSSSAIPGHISDPDLTDNEASITFEGLAGAYEVVYTYGMESISIKSSYEFLVYEVELRGIYDLPDTVCKNDLPYPLLPELGTEDPFASYSFSGPGVSGDMSEGFMFNPGAPDVATGLNEILLNYTSSNGCRINMAVDIHAALIPLIRFEPDQICLSLEGSAVSFTNLTIPKEAVASWNWDFGDPASGAQNVSDLENPEHFYAESGPRNIVLKVSTHEACVAEYSLDTLLVDKPRVNFTWETDCYSENQAIPFLATVESDHSDLDTLIWTIHSTEGGEADVFGRSPGDINLDYSFGSLDSYELSLHAENEAGCVGEQSRSIELIPEHKLSDTDYMETFDHSLSDWAVISEDLFASWVLGIPDFAGFEAIEGDRAWYTSLPSQPEDYLEHSWVRTPCFDFSDIISPVIQMDLMKSFMPGRDGAVLQYQDLISEGWKTVGALGSGLNWYNDTSILHRPGGGDLGWGLSSFEPDTRWQRARHHLRMIAGTPHVKFRVALATGKSQEVSAGLLNQGMAFNNFSIGEANLRRSVLEYFTNSSGESMFAVDYKVNQFAMQHAGLVYDLHYHMSYPEEDPMNDNNPLPPSTRAFNYGVPDVPYAILNGGESQAYRFDLTQPGEEIREDILIGSSLETPVFELFLSVDYMGDSLKGKVTTVCLDPDFDSFLQLYLVVIEKEVGTYYWLNQDSSFRNVVLDILPTPAGVLLGNNWDTGETAELEFAWKYASFIEDAEDLSVVAFVQDRESGAILQATDVPFAYGVGFAQNEAPYHPLSVYPNPTGDFCTVNFGDRTLNRGQLVLLDISGRELTIIPVEKGTLIQNLELAHLSEGLYMLLWKEAGILKGEAKLILQ